MGTKDNPQKSNLLLRATGAVVLSAAVAGGYLANDKINDLEAVVEKQDVTLKAQEKKLEEQGSLTDQQAKEIQSLNDQNIHLNHALTKQKSEFDSLIKQKDESIQKKESEIKQLKQKAAVAASASAKTLPSRGEASNYKEFYVSATGYTAYCDGCSGKTAWRELDLRQNPSLKVIAVDPRVIPLGSKVWVEGYGYAVAADKGGAIKGHKVDLFYPNKSTALQWGRKTVKIKVFN